VKRKNNTLDSGFVLSNVNPFKEGEKLVHNKPTKKRIVSEDY